MVVVPTKLAAVSRVAPGGKTHVGSPHGNLWIFGTQNEMRILVTISFVLELTNVQAYLKWRWRTIGRLEESWTSQASLFTFLGALADYNSSVMYTMSEDGSVIFLRNPVDGFSMYHMETMTSPRHIPIMCHPVQKAQFHSRDLGLLDDNEIVTGSDSGVYVYDRKTYQVLDVLHVDSAGKWVQTITVSVIVIS
jgi:hypothetical protein